ncbi:tetratricopeptide repeat protein [Spirosoma sp. BT702]|uniref:histidine kinase n=1 Tax=Spirosoma profusum TaxID=2771354 RepID=A0A927G9X2_9BACT|nr:histidine kinase dimerization/phosphoacceptor domain -containing protein [Spirosoma profusum]MBD2705066.1 tetratricopeptide repeat protein [Spirosoma profusum]
MKPFYKLSAILLILVPNWLYAQSGMLPASKANAPDSVKLWTLREIGDSLINAGQTMEARKAYEQALAMAKEVDRLDDIGLGYRAIGYWHQTTGDPSGAIDWYLKALDTFEKSGNRRKQARTAAFIGFAYDRLHKLPEARRYLLHGIELAQQGGYDKELYELYGNMANLEGQSQHYGQAMAYTQKILTYYKSKKDTVTYYGVLFNLAQLYKKQKQYVRAEQTFRNVLAYADKYNDDFVRGYVYSSLPAVLIPQNKLAEAEKDCQRALVWVDSTGTAKHTTLEEIYGHLSQIWEKRGDYRQALLFYKRQMASHDSVFNATKNQQVTELETRYQTRQKEENIKQLATTNALQKQQIWIGGSSLILMTILLATLAWFYRRIQLSRTKIQQQADQLALMMKELHHRVKNNLAIVSSLLKLQSNRLEDEKAIQAVRVGQQRVEAMALIHQRLYQTDIVTTVNMREYLTDLAQSLMQAYDYQPAEFDLQLNIEQQDLDVDMAMPLGLIVNELVTNAFKYAYGNLDDKRPMLRIDLRPEAIASQSSIILEVQDNGPGINQSDWQKKGAKASFGKRLIASLSEQLEGEFELLKQNGTLFRLQMPTVRSY